MNTSIALRVIAVGVAVFMLAGCVTSDASPSAESPLKSALKTLNFATDVPPPAKFVVDARPATPAPYLPIQGALSEPDDKLLSPAEVVRQTSQLDATRQAQAAIKLKPAEPPQ